MANEKAGTSVGATVVINGEFKSDEDVSIQGTIKGRIETTADLFIEESGTVEAEIATRNIDVRGTIVGNVTATDRFEVHPGGSITGDVRAPRVVLADGAKYKGHIDMAGGSASSGSGNSSSRREETVPAKVERKRG